MTCYHVITKEILDSYNEIKLILNNDSSKKLNLEEKRNVLYDEKLDFMAIEIKNKDEININSFEINVEFYNYKYDNEKYDKKNIIIPSFEENNNKVELQTGIINYLDNKRFIIHNCNNIPEYSGAPIISISNTKIIGIYTGFDKTINKDACLFFYNILKYIKEKSYKKEVILNTKKDWWRLCRDFCNVYLFFRTGLKYSSFAEVRNIFIENACKSLLKDIPVLKEWIISITHIFFQHFLDNLNLNISFKNNDSKKKITQQSQKITVLIKKYLECLLENANKLENIPERVQQILYNYIKDNGYFTRNYLSTYQISRIDFNFYGGTKKLKDDQVSMILTFLIISGVTVQQFLLHMKENFIEFRNYPNIDISAKYIGSILHYLCIDTFNNKPSKLNDIFALMNFYRNYYIYNDELEMKMIFLVM